VELLEGGASSLEVGEFHLRIFAGEDDAVGVAVEGGEDGSPRRPGDLRRMGSDFSGKQQVRFLSGAKAPKDGISYGTAKAVP
jgi:hypothetical protein